MARYKFSIVIPIYNVEDYMEETILSVINQTIGFKENIQMILVNDGTPDNSESICLKYKEMYPDNIVYIKQKNSGVSAARNNGKQYVQGEIVNFLDSDDKWELNAFEKVYKFFQAHMDIDVVACPLQYFEAKKGFSHPLNFKFKNDSVIDINLNPELIQMHMASCFIKANAIKHDFCTELKYGEDSLFINQIILEKRKYGIMKSTSYLYRKRLSESSAIDTCQLKSIFYNQTLTYFHDEIINYSKEKFGKILHYVQFLVMYDLQWRIKRPIPEGILSENEIKDYISHIKSILNNIDDFVIMEQKNIWNEHKIYALNLKYNTDITSKLERRRTDFYYNDIKIFSGKLKSLVSLSSINVKSPYLILEGIINTPLKSDDYSIIIEDNEGLVYDIIDVVEYKKHEKKCLEGHFYYNQFFKIKIPLKRDTILKLNFYFKYKNETPIKMDIGTTSTCLLNDSTKNGYLKLKNNIIEYKGNQIVVRNNSRKLHAKHEKAYCIDLYKKGFKKLVLYRIVRFILYYLIKKEIWLISDRPDKAGDNGEAFFEYLQTIKHKGIAPYFVINKTSEDYKKMKKIGKVINYNSIRYRLMVLLASKIISSQASDYVINPFKNRNIYMKDLYTFDFVFLQHGITKDDLSNWLNKQSKNIKMFVTAGIPEYNSIINGDYYYDESIVKLTGFPRHDNLLKMNNMNNKQIAIIPTWRKSIPGCIDSRTDKSIYNPDFKESEFFKFYNSLINDERLLKVMKDNGYTGLFCLHPLFNEQYKHFTENDIIKVNKGYVDYQKIFTEYSLLVTDYSSVFFDFAYLNKPVIYCQFDENEFFAGHSYDKGYFEYEKDGFGEVSKTIDETVTNIINCIENGCTLSEKYKKRIDAFYPKERGHNSENVYNEILRL